MVFPNSFHKDSFLNCRSNGDLNTADSYDPDSSPDSKHYSEPLLRPPQNPFHHHHHDGSPFNNFPSLLSADLTVNDLSIPYADVPEQEWLSEFLYSCFNDNFLGTGETMAEAGFSAAQSDASFTSKDDHKGSRVAGGKLRPNTEPNVGSSSSPGEGSGKRRCTHCAADHTPQWRTGPLGPKTLCNACGVRYKSGRLVPEYRPASSPTFVLSQHSNSQRKVLELRKQKEMMLIKEQAPHV